MNRKIVPIVFATNDNYAPYLGVALHSLILHTTPEYEYRVHILSTDLNRHHRKKLLSMAKDNVSIELVDVSQWMESFHIPQVGHLSPETTYRLLIDRLFPQYEKVLYLDCDLVINRDVAQLYETNLDGAILGACLGELNISVSQYIREHLRLSSEKYFNAGVLLIDIPRFTAEYVGEIGLQMLSKHTYMTQDQDVLNLLCKDQVRYIDSHWNMEWQYSIGKDDVVIDPARAEQLSCRNDPYIIHYTSGFKPWNHPENEWSEYFWKYARQTVFYEEILLNAVRYIVDPPVIFTFPWNLVEQNKRIILYGAGNVGRDYLHQLRKAAYCQLVAVCDRTPEQHGDLRVPVIGPETLRHLDYDMVLIAVNRQEVAQEIMNDCIALGVAKEKIVWGKPREILR